MVGRNSGSKNWFLYACLCVFLFIIFLNVFKMGGKNEKGVHVVNSSGVGGNRTLIVYAYRAQTKLHEQNLEFFVKYGVFMSDKVDFVFVLNETPKVDEFSNKFFPNGIPENVHVLYRSNDCYDFGGWIHGLNSVDRFIYEYFIFLNASVRGPFMAPAIARVVKHWPSIFLNMLDKNIKLVGSSISCGGKLGVMIPHVQVY